METKNLLFIENAVKETLQRLKKRGYTWNNIRYINKGRYCIVYGRPNIAITLKTEPFFNFGYKFRNGQEEKGDSINKKEFEIFEKEGVQHIYCHLNYIRR